MIAKDLNNVEQGSIAEAYVLYKLLRWGYDAQLTRQGNSYDIIILHQGTAIKVQVKSTQKKQEQSYKFQSCHGASVRRPYTKDDCDILCVVALELEFAYFMNLPETLTVRVKGSEFTKENEYGTFKRLIKDLTNN